MGEFAYCAGNFGILVNMPGSGFSTPLKHKLILGIDLLEGWPFSVWVLFLGEEEAELERGVLIFESTGIGGELVPESLFFSFCSFSILFPDFSFLITSMQHEHFGIWSPR